MPQSTDSYHSALDFLYGRVNYERTAAIPYQSGGIKLERMIALLGELGNPHHRLPVVHVAGTKGKGSTCLWLDSICRAAGLRVGLFTSPHLERIEERIVLNGQVCSEIEFVQLTARVAEAVARLERASADPLRRMSPTFFEITTAMAMLHFEQAAVDLAILEVGLGGRLDSTNVCRPIVSVITSISYDHMKQLGNTLTLIAGEKAQIIKPGVPVISGAIEDEPAAVIRARAQEVGSPLYEWQHDFDARCEPDSTNFTFHWSPREAPGSRLQAPGDIRSLSLPVAGDHQVANASLAIATTMVLREKGFDIPDRAIEEGLQCAQLPGRIECVGQSPVTIIDTAHNAASITALCDVLRRRFPEQKKIVIFAVSRDKDVGAMLGRLVEDADHLILTRFTSSSRSVDVEELLHLAETFEGKARLHVAGNSAAAWEFARRITAPSDVLCVTGSFFLAGELRSQAISDSEITVR
jgi:dihydrofolate synthase/folylpolyglutamate synthase